MKIFSYFETDKDLPTGWNHTKVQDFHQFSYKNYTQTFYLQHFPGDCGTLILRGVDNISREGLQLVRKIASMCGYDTVICTYVNLRDTTDTDVVQNFRKERWIKAVDGKSNRKHNYAKNRKIVYILHIRNCEHKGY